MPGTAPPSYQLDVEADLSCNSARSWITTKIGEDEQDIAVRRKTGGEIVYYRGCFPSVEAAEMALFQFVDRARAGHEVMAGPFEEHLP